MLQNLALFLSLLCITVLAVSFLWIIRKSGWPDDLDRAKPAATLWRKRLLVGLTVLFIPVIGYSLTKMPYVPRHDSQALIIHAKGYQWRWELSQDTVPVGTEVAFHVTAADVNHGFALYDEKLQLKAQTQAMPGLVNVLRYRFDRAGTYKVLCLEYCGMAHHNMTAEIRVVAQ